MSAAAGVVRVLDGAAAARAVPERLTVAGQGEVDAGHLVARVADAGSRHR